MVQTFRSFPRGRRLLAIATTGCAALLIPWRSAQAQGTAESATISSTGLNSIESGGAYPNTSGSNRYLDVGAGYKYMSFATLDFTTGSFGISYPVTSVNSLTLSLSESNTTTTAAGSFTLYLTEDTSPVGTANGGAPLKYQSSAGPSGIGTQLGDSSTLFALGTFTSAANGATSQADKYTLTLSSAAQSYFVSQLNGASTNDLRLVIGSNDTTGYGTFNGNTSVVSSANQPTLSFNAVLNLPTLSWTPNGATGGSGTWLPAGTAGDTSWNGGPWDSTKVAQFGGPSGTVAIGMGGVSTTGIQFNASGYTIGTTNGPAVTVTATSSGSAPALSVNDASYTATINAPIAGTGGLNKQGAGTLVLGGPNTYMGGTILTAGTLQISADNNLGDVSGALTLGGGTLHVVGSPTLARGIGGTGSIQVDGGATVSLSGVMNAVGLTLPGAGTLALLNGSFSLNGGGSSNAITGGASFTTAGASLVTSSDGRTLDGGGVLSLGGISATQTSGVVTLNAIASVAGTVTVNVANSGATLNLPGSLMGTTAVIAKAGAGTLVLGGDNSGLGSAVVPTGGTTAPASFRQGTAGASPLSGGTVSIALANPNPGSALGVGLFDANGGTVSNDSGAAVNLALAGVSIGAQNATTTPGGLVFAGANAITVNGPIGLYRGGANAYQHAITVNTPTTFTGMFTLNAAGTSTGLTIYGSSTLTLAGTAANAFTEAVTIATSGANSGVIAKADGTFAANTSITISPGATLTLSTGATSGTVNAINDSALVAFQVLSGSFGKLALNIGSGMETVGGLYLASGDGTLPAGYQPAGTYGPTGSGATHIDNTLFSGAGVINDLATAVPEPSTWAVMCCGLGLFLLWRLRRGALS